MSNLVEHIENITKSDRNFAPTLFHHHVLPDTNFNGPCLMNKIYIPEKVINLYISDRVLLQIKTNMATTAQDLILVQNFRSKMEVWEKNFIIFGADMSSSVHIYNKYKNIYILGEISTRTRLQHINSGS